MIEKVIKPLRLMATNVILPNNIMEKVDIEKHKKDITKLGISGLRNIGNTCYSASALQCLNVTILFSTYLAQKNFKEDLESNLSQKLIIEKKKKTKEGSVINLTDKDSEKFLVEETRKSVVYNLYLLFRQMWD